MKSKNQTQPIMVHMALFALLFVGVGAAEAATYYWSGTGNWSETSRWFTTSGGTVNAPNPPGSGDTAVFDTNSVSCTMDVEVSVAALTLGGGVLDLNGFNLTVAGTFENTAVLRLRGDEALAITGDPDSGTIEYYGDGDGQADTYAIKPIVYFNLRVNFTDAADTLSYTGPGNNTLDDGFLGYWPFDDGAGASVTDASRKGRTGTLTNMDPANDWVTGAPLNFANPGALDFDGTDDLVDFPTPDPGDFHNEFTERTVSAWVTIDSNAGPNMIYEEGGGTNGFVLGYRSSPDTIIFTTAQNKIRTELSSTSTFLPGTGQWVHVLAIYNNGQMRLYINGVQQASGTNSTAIPYHSSDPDIGGTDNGSTALDSDNERSWHGRIDDLRVYGRALSAAEVAVLAAGNNSNAPTVTVTAIDVNGELLLDGGAFTAPNTINLAGNLGLNGATFTHNGGTVDFDGATTISGNNPTFADVLITGAVTSAAGLTINVDGNWSNGGVFNPADGTVAFTNASSCAISGSTNFHNWSCTVPSKAFTFESGTTQMIAGALTLDGGDAGTRIQLRSGTPGSTWSINPQGSRSAAFVDVQDSVNLTGPAINPVNSMDSGNTTLWFDLAANPSATPTAIAVGQTTQLSCNPTGGVAGSGYTYLWSGPDSFTSTLQDPPPVSPPGQGFHTYTVVVTDGISNTVTGQVIVAVGATPVVASATASPTALVNGDATDLIGAATGGTGVFTSWQWTGPGGFTSTLQNPTGVVPPALGPNAYTVTVTDSFGLQDTAQVTVNVAAAPLAANPAVSESVVVAGDPVDLSSMPSGGSGTYVGFAWTGPSGFSSSLQNPGTFKVPSAGFFVFTLTVTDSYGLTSTETVSVASIESALVPHPAATPDILTAGASTTLGCNPTGGTGVYVGFAWTGPNGFSSTQQNPGSITPPLPGANTYTVTVTDASGLVVSDSVTILVGVTLESLSVSPGSVRYRVSSQSRSGKPQDVIKVSIQGLDLRVGDNLALLFNKTSIGNLATQDVLTLDGKFRARGQLGTSSGVFHRCRAKYIPRRRKLTFIAARGSAVASGQSMVMAESGTSASVPVVLLVDHAPADGVADLAAVVPVVFRVRFQSQSNGGFTESERMQK